MNHRIRLSLALLVSLPVTTCIAGGGGGGSDTTWYMPPPICVPGGPVSYQPVIRDLKRDQEWLRKFQQRVLSIAGSIAANAPGSPVASSPAPSSTFVPTPPGSPAAIGKAISSDVAGMIEDLIDEMEKIKKCG
ncbi:MAG TPA: hypothetical protein PLY75_00860 [Gammaproteobacteria bacterium]|nr:hypothetical protein [Gammaproteobacteria bacterium]HPQ23453.1 hypothetical protein [Gammaproteobacteria bacterium]